jgi:hypothetical protein
MTDVEASRRTSARRRSGRPGRSQVRMVRLSMDVPASLHKRLRMRALMQDRTMTDHVVGLIERDLAAAEHEREGQVENGGRHG